MLTKKNNSPETFFQVFPWTSKMQFRPLCLNFLPAGKIFALKIQEKKKKDVFSETNFFLRLFRRGQRMQFCQARIKTFDKRPENFRSLSNNAEKKEFFN